MVPNIERHTGSNEQRFSYCSIENTTTHKNLDIDLCFKEAEGGIKINGTRINYIRYGDNTVLIVKTYNVKNYNTFCI